jgi:peptide/nickel transport system permease protein
MSRFLVGRLVAMVPVLFGVTLAVFILIRLTPGDPAAAILGTQANPTDLARLRHAMGLDRPAPLQYLHWLTSLAHGDLGVSYRNHMPVAHLLATSFPVTAELTAVALLIALLVGVPSGVAAAAHRYTRFDYAVSGLALFGISLPGFWLGLLLILLFALVLGWLPASGYTPLSAGLWPNLKSLILPGVAVGVFSAGVLSRYVRAAMMESLEEDYVRTARAKGLGDRVVIYRHALRNALIPTVTVLGLQLAFLLGGAVVIEQVFALPGMGQLALNAIETRDYPIIQGVTLFVGVIFVVINFVVDVLYTAIDPRIRYGG